MRLTAFSDVSLRVLMLLSALEPGQKLSTQKIAEGVDTPCNVLAKAREAFYASVDSVIISELTAGARPVGPVFVELGFGPPENALPAR